MEIISVTEGNFLLLLQEVIRHPWLDIFFTFITNLGNAGWIWILAGIILLACKKHRREGTAVLLALLIGFIITNLLLKNIVARPRPYTLLNELEILIKAPSDYSFPSGHTCSSVAAALTMLKLSDRRLGIAACILAALIAFSRMYVGVHYPTDVIIGALIGAFSAVVSVRVINRNRILNI
ncbi:MAG: phosphatase PAP2 family protein [Coprococcus sp.]